MNWVGLPATGWPTQHTISWRAEAATRDSLGMMPFPLCVETQAVAITILAGRDTHPPATERHRAGRRRPELHRTRRRRAGGDLRPPALLPRRRFRDRGGRSLIAAGVRAFAC